MTEPFRDGTSSSGIQQGLLDALDDAVVIASSDGVVYQINRAFERLLGYSRAGLPYRPPLPWVPTTTSATPSASEAMEQYQRIADRAHSDPSGATLTELSHADGHLVSVSVTFSRFDSEGTVLALMRDVTAHVQRAQRHAALTRLSGELAGRADPREIAEVGLRRIAEHFATDAAGLRYDEIGLVLALCASGDEADVRAGLVRALEARSDRDTLAFDDGSGDPASEDTPVGSVAVSLFGIHGALWLGWHEPRPLQQDERDLLATMCTQVGHALQRASLDLERRQFATSIQQSLLANTHVPAHAAARYQPALQPFDIGGDWYDILDLGEGRSGLVIGDCVGRGVGAATTMTKLRAASRALLLRSPQPLEVLTTLDRFTRVVEQAYCATVFVGVVEPDGTLRWSSAAHPPGLLLRGDGTVERLEGARSAPLGVRTVRTEANVELEQGDRVIVFTDGLVERRNENPDVGLERLAATVRELRSEPVETMAQRIVDILATDGGYSDDVALLVFEHRAVPPFRSAVVTGENCLHDLRHDLRAWLNDAGASAHTLEDMTLAVNEAVANALEHSVVSAGAEPADPPPPVLVEAYSNGSLLTVKVKDGGRWRTPEGSERDPTRGRGLRIIRSLSSSFELIREDSGTTVTMTHPLP